ncbi:MAG: ComEA family DNA-binding protein [Halioglobus sp.]
MNKFTIKKPQLAAVTLTSRPSTTLFGALGFALLLGLNPLLTSNYVHAKEPTPAAAVTSVNINNADAQTLATNLKGVGLSRAKEIVRYRETYGPFASVDELEEVKGVGLSTIEKNRVLLTLE